MTDLSPCGQPSPWVIKHALRIKPNGNVLDMACGSGRHAIWLMQQGYQVVALDKNKQALLTMTNIAGIHLVCADLESESWPYGQHQFDGIVVSRYLHRPLFPKLAMSLNPGGILIYETFMLGNEHYGKPSNPDFLLQTDELFNVFKSRLHIIAFKQGLERTPKMDMMQKLCAVKLVK